ncbi:hypothetical protein L873DRAFT_1667302 [Choiromyces venosus 120613-1]|uniref:ATPase synthesis protein 25 n=1 Tax=Choiromyces venosus 120613-1 TaxID=1336337 RepID=A0A3N4KEG9_9PEZI|nr:hypothetical protein L873DRAFT_1667302 [Choiromyces venosus 120613-1]
MKHDEPQTIEPENLSVESSSISEVKGHPDVVQQLEDITKPDEPFASKPEKLSTEVSGPSEVKIQPDVFPQLEEVTKSDESLNLEPGDTTLEASEISEVKEHPNVFQKIDNTVESNEPTIIEPARVSAEASGVPESTTPAPPKTGDSKGESLPWYLRVKTPISKFHPLADRQALPPLPENPPPALQAVLAQLSVEEGIDDLKVLDLRALDPAPALGEDIVMIIGTAYSGRQLHMCSDRTCRWLRKEFDMRPFADGLVGRGELKLQQRRARRRGKLTTAQSGIEEAAGWVCITAGGQGLVIQLFTRDKREEIDLESLWSRELERDSKKRKAEERVAEGKEQGTFGAFGRGLSTKFPILGSAQARSFHSSSKQPSQVVTESPAESLVRFAEEGISINTHVRKGHYWRLVPRVSEAFDPDADLKNAAYLMEAHINHLRNKFRGNNYSGKLTGGCKLLGRGIEDRTSTPFLQSYFRYFPKHPAPPHLRLHLQFLIETNRINSEKYPLTEATSFLKTFPAPIPVELYYICMRAIADSPEHRSYKIPASEAATLRLSLIQDLVDHFDPTSTKSQHIPEFRFCKFRALAHDAIIPVLLAAKTVCSTKRVEAGKEADGAIEGFHIRVGTYALDPRLVELERKSIDNKHNSYAIREYIEQAMAAYVSADHWTALWNRWKNLKYMSVRRDQAFYELLIGLVVLGRKQKEGVYAARHIWNDMGRETPRVLMTAGIAKGLLAVVKLAERDSSTSGEFAELKARCNGYLEGWHKWRVEKGLVKEEKKEGATATVAREKKSGESNESAII